MKLQLIGHDEKYAVEQSLLTLFPDERPVYGEVDETADDIWAVVTLEETENTVCVTTELCCAQKRGSYRYDFPLSGSEYEKEGQRRHAIGMSFFRTA
ncbi:MAG: coproporphyrinogen dehydrogenase HemZ, partial [Oscillospiraceae bacterium]|nr:coproporphyrinogen dehydrogenase HemZ [Oscillospiraceae bacterium]